MKRTSYCGALRETNVNQIHTVMGWVQNKRDMGGVIFIDLRDREGILQVVFDGRNLTPEAFAAAEALKLESVIAVEGPLRIRGEETYNPKLVTGTIELADMLGLRKPGDYRFLIVTDFPEFEYSQEEGRYLATHHPFTMPYPEDIPYLISDPARVRAQAYDVVLNGVELGSGSMRIHQKDVQRKMFEALGFSEEQIQERFGFMVNAFQYGTPPHGGFAFGLDRLAMQMLEAESLRDVIAFPKNKDAVCPMTQAPNVAAHTAKLTNVFREDIPQTSCPRELLLENAPEQHDGCVFVPQVVE